MFVYMPSTDLSVPMRPCAMRNLGGWLLEGLVGGPGGDHARPNDTTLKNKLQNISPVYKCDLQVFTLVQKGRYSYIVADYDCCVVGVHFHLDWNQSSGRRYILMHLLIVFMSVLIRIYRG